MFDRYTIEILDSYFKGPIDEYHFVHNLDGVMDCMMSKRGGVVHMYNTLSENLLEYLRARRISDEDEKLLLMTIMMNSHGIFFPEDNEYELNESNIEVLIPLAHKYYKLFRNNMNLLVKLIHGAFILPEINDVLIEKFIFGDTTKDSLFILINELLELVVKPNRALHNMFLEMEQNLLECLRFHDVSPSDFREQALFEYIGGIKDGFNL